MTTANAPTSPTPAPTEPLIVSVSGLRGVVGATLNGDVAAAYALAFTETLPPGPIVLGRDGRESGPALKQAIDRSTAVTNVPSTPSTR